MVEYGIFVDYNLNVRSQEFIYYEMYEVLRERSYFIFDKITAVSLCSGE